MYEGGDYMKEEKKTNIVFGIISFILPILGAILYYVYKKSNPARAKIINRCSWLGFIFVPLVCALVSLIFC